MPLMDGLEATRRIHELPGLGQLPVVALTANAFEATRQKAREAGMRDFLAKPIDVEASVALLRGFIAATPVKSLAQDGPHGAGRPLAVPPRPRVAQPSSQVPDVARGLKVFRTVPVYLRNLRRFLQQPEYSPEAILAGSPAEAAIRSHTMRSTAGYLGLNEIESCCQAFENVVRGGEDGTAERAALAAALTRGRAAVRDYIDSEDTGQNGGGAQPPRESPRVPARRVPDAF